MNRRLSHVIAVPVAIGLAASGLASVALVAGAASSSAVVPGDGTPSQAQLDTAATSGSQGQWGDMAGGVASRPYVRSLAVINGGVSIPVITGGTASAPTTAAGDVTAVVAPVNLCKTGQSPSPGSCYATPNRVSVQLVYATGSDDVMHSDGINFAAPTTALNQPVTSSTVFDMTIALNTLGQTLRWSWANGDLVRWETSNLGTPDAAVRIQFRPSQTPSIDWSAAPAGNGCTATPIFNCDIAQAAGEYLGASLLLSLDNTMNPALTGAVFATQGAVSGFLDPQGTAEAPALDMQIASSHLTSTGALNTGRLKAFLPSQTLLNLYGVLPSDASGFFAATRSGSAGTNSAPTFTEWTAAANGSEGVLVDVRDITFSVPTYKVVRKTTALKSKAKVKGKTATVTVRGKVKQCGKGCTVTVYRLGSEKYTSSMQKVGSAKSRSGVPVVTVNKGKLKKKSRYLATVRYASGKHKGDLIKSGLGTA